MLSSRICRLGEAVHPRLFEVLLVSRQNVFFLVICAVLMLSVSQAWSQQPGFRNYSTPAGLPSSETYMVKQDQKGFIWVATDGGVVRYDGNQFEVYDQQDGLLDPSVFGMFEDHTGRIWFYSYSNQLFYFEDDQFVSHPANPTLQKDLRLGLTISLQVDQDGVAWMGTSHLGLVKVYPDGKTEFYDNRDPVDKGKRWFHVRVGAERQALFGRYPLELQTNSAIGAGMSVEDASGNTFRFDDLILEFSGWRTPSGLHLKDGRMLIGIGSDLYEMGESGSMKIHHLNQSMTASLFEDRNQHVFAGFFRGGVRRYRNGRLDSEYDQFLDGLSVTSVCQDSEGGYWFTTIERGVFYAPSLDFTSVFTFDEIPSPVMGLGVAEDAIYAGLRNGALIKLPRSAEGPIVQSKANVDEVFRFLKLEEGPLCVVSSTGVYQQQSDDDWPLLLKASTAWNANGKVFFAKSQGGHFYDPVTQEISTFLEKTDFDAKTLVMEPNGTIWVGTINGLMRVTKEGGKYFLPTVPLFRKRVRDLHYIAADSSLLICTIGGGLVRLWPEKEEWEVLNEDNALITNNINRLVIDAQNTYWLATNQGIIRINYWQDDSVNLVHYNNLNGLISNEINDLVVDGNLVWVASDGGLMRFNRDLPVRNSILPRVHINQLIINGHDTAIKSEYDLKYNQNDISFAFSGLAYKNARQIPYRYRLKGLEDNWTQTYSREAHYVALPAGNYSFEVQAQNNDGLWGAVEQPIQINLSPAFWTTFWFIALVGLTGVLVIYATFYFRFRNLKIRSQLILQSNESEQKALRAQMTPHFLFNALNSIQYLIIQNDKRQAANNVSNLADLMRRILRNSQESFVSLTEELETIRLYLDLESLRFKGKFVYRIVVDDSIDQENVLVPTMLVQPYVENAIWHGIMKKEKAEGQVEIKIVKQGDYVLCSVSDDGVGRERAKSIENTHVKNNKDSRGMAISKERIRLLNQQLKRPMEIRIVDLRDDRGEAAGTRIELLIPISEG